MRVCEDGSTANRAIRSDAFVVAIGNRQAARRKTDHPMYQMPIPDSPEPGEPQRGFPIKDAKPWMNRVSAILLAIDGMLGTLALLSWAVQLLNAAN